MRQAFFFDALSGICHRIHDIGYSVRYSVVLYGKSDRSLLRILDRIVQDVNEYLFDPDLITVQLRRNIGRYLDVKIKPFLAAPQPQHPDKLG